MVTGQTPGPPAEITRLARLEYRLDHVLRDLRSLRYDMEEATKDRGVLGSRGLTEFLLGVLRQQSPLSHASPVQGYTIRELQQLAEQAGYVVPTSRTLSSRLRTRAYQTGDLRYDATGKCWHATRRSSR